MPDAGRHSVGEGHAARDAGVRNTKGSMAKKISVCRIAQRAAPNAVNKEGEVMSRSRVSHRFGSACAAAASPAAAWHFRRTLCAHLPVARQC